MKSPIKPNPQQILSENQKTALVKLLADDDPAVHETVRETILALGEEGSSWLRPHTLSNDPLVRKRSLEIILHFARQNADNEFLLFCLRQGEEFDIEEGSFLLACTQYPDLNIEAYRALFDHYAQEIKERLEPEDPGRAVLGKVNEYLFEDLGFSGDEENFYAPENSYLNQVVDSRRGNPISLCMVYLFIARRLRLPMTGIGMPGHFLVRFQTSREEIYVDAFNEGKLLTKADCIKYLVRTNGFRDTLLSPISARRILLRMCSNLHQIYSQLEWAVEVTRLQRYIVALAK
jgi:regulator of sirC expression with transglutaminase-like and TPR domain